MIESDRDAYFVLRNIERDLEKMVPDIEQIQSSERTPRIGEVANLLMSARCLINELLDGGEIPELEATLTGLRKRTDGLMKDPTSAGRHDSLCKEGYNETANLGGH